MDFNTFKIHIIETTGLAKDALHIYVGVGVYLFCLFALRPIIKKQSVRGFIALIVVTGVALLGEYLDNRHIILPKGVFALKIVDIKASIHDLINTCLLPFMLFVVNKWTRVFQPTSSSSKMLKKSRT
ncbi:hypothetical protein [uncultured Psychrobacter sp.]|uniref:hypothetical protein n=1 Tax=uncultured Psychrobacter sp. TaxID=259303 RepID=UPI0034585ADA